MAREQRVCGSAAFFALLLNAAAAPPPAPNAAGQDANGNHHPAAPGKPAAASGVKVAALPPLSKFSRRRLSLANLPPPTAKTPA